ncbi:cryptochrome/photolyase family protein [Phenylobacterium montanum]|uniref:Cryptochrome/photolyase family protein n=1 Tax=Phenylobacterium montanum TaxID=2823693 RepID=A0A975G293_9CAUL|nr:cryptochrome/photolyase family protein [Caulobacter sp. S6]QUD89795.1 cryptochrome/photolyase family protein [Caulobacter sp. S6]
MKRLRLVLGDQLSLSISSLKDFDRDRDVVLMVEVAAEAKAAPNHVQKLVLIWSAMRHFASQLRQGDIAVDYVRLDDPSNRGDLVGELERAVERIRPDEVVVTRPGAWRVYELLNGAAERLGVPVTIIEDDRFFSSPADFSQWAAPRKQWRMEHFYRGLRIRTGLLMKDGAPVGGVWNLDAQNRKPLAKGLQTPRRQATPPDALTREVMTMVTKRFPNNFGQLDGFGWAVTRSGALEALGRFLDEGLARFGDYQDAMARSDPFLFHSLISPYLNLGLLEPREVCAAAEAAYWRGAAPLNAVEGFIRQILGWREYVRGVYWALMPSYPRTNALSATRPLPGFYWTADTDLNCIRTTVVDIRRNAYAHHIQRLMVTGNFALLAGVAPGEVEAWYLGVFADAFEWVELPNVHGMALFADGGRLASKPYAASGAYIDRMSDYCHGCRFDPKQRSGPEACPFNYLYWDFLMRNRAVLGRNPRLAMPYRSLDAFDAGRRSQITKEAASFLASLDGGAADE